MWSDYFRSLLILLSVVRENNCELISDENLAREFLRCRDETIIRRCENKEDWQYFDVGRTTDNFTWQSFTDPFLRRAFNITAQQESYFSNLKENQNKAESKRQREIRKESLSIYKNSGACIYQDEEMRQSHENCKVIPQEEIRDKFFKVGNADERKYYWVTWRDSVGKIKGIFDERMRIDKSSNKYPDIWLKAYEETSPTILQDVDEAFQEIFPLYKELHAFVRRRLINTYTDEQIRSNGPIPAHLLDVVTDFWLPVRDIAWPYPEEKVDITEILKERNMKTIDLLKLAEDFYNSLGLPRFDVWNNSKISKDERCKRTLDLHTFCNGTLSGINACIPIDEFTLHATISYLVNIYTLGRNRPDWPRMIALLPSIDFRAALGQLVELSTWTNKYMAQKGFVQSADSDQTTAHDMNDLMKLALRFIPALSYAYKQIKWRWVSYTPAVSDSNYNQKWWEYSLKYQGTCPPVKRTENNFDPASSGRIIAFQNDVLSAFISTVYSFQFHKAICDEVGHDDFLHRCSLYGERAFGDKIRNIAYLGNSIPTTTALFVMTNGASEKLDAKPLLEYFQPLYEWLREKNENETIGWQSDDPMVCP